MTSMVGLTHGDHARDHAIRKILSADAFCSRPGTIALGHLGWAPVHPTTSSHDQPTKRSGQALVMGLALGMATYGRQAVLLEVG